MENRSHALIAGLFTLLLGLSAIAALWWFGGKSEDTKAYQVITTKSVTGLNPQAQVRYRGVRVGRVEAIEFDPSDIRNTLIGIRIRSDVPVTEGTIAKLGYQGVTGIAHVQLEETGANPAILAPTAGGLPRIPMRDSLIQELSATGAETLRNVRDLVASIHQVLSPENRQAIVKTLANLEAASGNAREASVQLRTLLTPENVRLLQATLQRAEQTVGQAAPFFAEARGLVARLQTVGDKLDLALGDPASGGVSALAPRLNELTIDLAVTSRQLGRVLQSLEDSPQSLIFGKQADLPGPGEAGFVVPASRQEKP